MMKGFFQRFRMTLARWMYGRYGGDALSNTLLVIALICMLLAYIPYLALFILPALLLCFWSLFRTLSRKLPARRRELERFLRIRKKLTDPFRLLGHRWRDRKTHRYLKCPKCRATLRLPRGKTDITVTCPRCGERFQKST